MGTSDGTRRRWLKYGCLGILGAIVVVALWTGVLFGLAWQRTRGEDVTRGGLTRAIAATDTGAPATSDAPLRVELDFTVGEFEVRGGQPGEPIRVDAEFDQRSYALEESFEPGPPGAGIYRVGFRETSWLKDSGLRVLFGGHRPHVVVHLPPDIPIELVGRFSKGGTSLELGGLWLTNIDIDMEKGGMHVGVDRPLVEPVERFSINARQGGFSARGIGNASPRYLDIDASMGGATFDLRGEWLRDADVSVRHWVGSGHLILPRNVDVEGIDRGTGLRRTRESEIPRPQVRVSLSSGIGRFHVE